MEILIIGKNPLISSLIKNHLVQLGFTQGIEVTNPQDIDRFDMKYQYILVNNLFLTGDISNFINKIETLISDNNYKNIIFLDRESIYTNIDRYTTLSRDDDINQLNKILIKKRFPHENPSKENEISTEAFLLNNTLFNENRDLFKTLTRKQLIIIKLILSRFTYEQIADHMDISKNTVKKHIQAIYKKLEINNKKELRNLFNYNKKRKNPQKRERRTS